ncbi:MAG TPA: hypothetical protein ENI98_06340, partial [Gammaproteobacteria bacterium]|nr:hypothetical protein [Gammaproteobacteria bacterium]
MKQTKKINWGWMFLSVLPVASLLAAGLGFAEPAIAGPDLQVRVWVDARSVHKNSNNTYNFTIRGYVKNVGTVNYVSRQNQQVLFLHKVGSSQHIADWHFTRLNRGQAMNVHVPVINQPGGEFVPSYELALSFDPDIYMDRNSANDDRNSRNNQATISSRTISGAFARASGGVQGRPVGVRTGGLDNPIILPKPRGKLTDLIPVVVNANQGAIQVKNIGGGSAGSSKLFVICSVVLSDGRNTVPCAAGLHMPNYDAANNTLMYRIPALRPGASHALRLFGPRALPRRPGIYGMKLFADGER